MKKLNLKFKLLSPLVHTEETSSNIANIYREKVIVDGEIQEIPTYHGNALRGSIRNLIFNHLLETIKFTQHEMKLDIFHMLFSGGALDSMNTSLDITYKQKIRAICPPLSLLGSAMGNEMLEGKLIVSSLYPECKELGTGELSHRDMIQIIKYTRQDDSKGKLGDKRLPGKADKPQQMIYDIECLVSGTVLTGEMIVDSSDLLEVSCFYTMIELLQNYGYIGGASRIGHGKVKLITEIDFEKETTVYKQFLSDNGEKIGERISTLS